MKEGLLTQMSRKSFFRGILYTILLWLLDLFDDYKYIDKEIYSNYTST